MFLCFYFLWSISYVLTAKIVPDLNNSLIFTWCERATVSKSLHVRSNFRCLIMAYTKLIQFVCHVILFWVKFTRNINHRYFDFCLNSQAGVTLCNLLHILCVGNILMNVLWIKICSTYLWPSLINWTKEHKSLISDFKTSFYIVFALYLAFIFSTFSVYLWRFVWSKPVSVQFFDSKSK